MSSDTIIALSTPPGVAALAVVRLSGPASRSILESLTNRPVPWEPQGVFYRKLLKNGAVLDDVVLTFWAGPHSSTGEDCVEISCHGNPRIVEAIQRACLARGARAARPGEFTQRAYLNDRLSLTEAEGLYDLIHASTERALASARAMKEGRLAESLEPLRAELLDLLSHLEASLDFAEEGIEPEVGAGFARRVAEVRSGVGDLLRTAPLGRILQEGALTVIFGEPNVGKSSLLNALLREDRAIVAPTPGTTRDLIEVPCQVHGLPLRLVDTAGQRESEDAVEQEGARRARAVFERAALRLRVVEAHQPFTQFAAVEGKARGGNGATLLVANKADLGRHASLPPEAVLVSARDGAGLPALELAMAEALAGPLASEADSALTVNARQEAALQRAASSLDRAGQALTEGLGLEVVSIELREALQDLADLIGHTTNEDVLGKIFANFCIGK